MPLLTAVDLSVGYAGRRRSPRTVLTDVSVGLDAGQLVCLLGPNGSGKSTLLRTLAGMQPPLAGRVGLSGRPLDTLTPRELARRVGVVLPERVSPGMLSAAALVALGRYPHTDWTGRLRPRDNDAVRQAMHAVGIEELAHRAVGHLSDGERQKVMIARALAQEPAVLVLDEPTAFLDLPGRVGIMALLSRLAHAAGGGDADTDGAGRAVVLSTHDLDLALRSADLVWLLDGHGHLTCGAPEDLVLGGSFEAAFARQAVRYDAESGSFHVAVEPTGTVWLQGSGLAGRWTRRALERRGYRVEEARGAEDPRVDVIDEDDERIWRLTNLGTSHSCNSIEELLKGLG